jgi:hypothetical protein
MRFGLYLVILLSYSLPSSISPSEKLLSITEKLHKRAMFAETVCIIFFQFLPDFPFFLSFEFSTTLVTLSTHRLLRYSISRL